jgi:hypothetical protein
MSQVQTGSCPTCGAPIYAESPFWSVMPPPPIYTCNCPRAVQAGIQDGTGTIPWQQPTIPGATITYKGGTDKHGELMDILSQILIELKFLSVTLREMSEKNR